MSGNVWEVQPNSTSLTPSIQPQQQECMQCVVSEGRGRIELFQSLWFMCVLPSSLPHLLLTHASGQQASPHLSSPLLRRPPSRVYLDAPHES